MSDDLIRRSDAIDEIRKECQALHSLGFIPLATVGGMVDAINHAPTIEPKREEWIPCSERLPEERLIVLVSLAEIYGLPSIGITYFNNGKWEDALYREVTAWMPLPKPYGEREGE